MSSTQSMKREKMEEKCLDVGHAFIIYFIHVGKECKSSILSFIIHLVAGGRRPRTTEQNNNSILIG